MSWFAYGTFKQDILDEIEWRIKDKGMTYSDAAVDIAEVLSYICSTAFNKDEALRIVKQEAKAEARKELIKQIEESK